MDTFSKGILTIITILLVIIAIGIWIPIIERSKMEQQPTIGYMKQLKGIKDLELRKMLIMDTIQKIPLIGVYGDVGVYGKVEIDE